MSRQIDIAGTLRDAVVFPFGQRKALLRLASKPLRTSLTITFIVNVVAFAGFQFPVFVPIQGLIDAALNATLFIVFLLWCSYAAAAIRIACGGEAGFDRFRFARPEIEFAFAVIITHAAVVALITGPVILGLTIVDHIAGTNLGVAPHLYFGLAVVVLAGFAIRILAAVSVVARGAVVNPAEVLRATWQDLPRFTIIGIVVFGTLAVLVSAANAWWETTSPTWRQIVRIAAPYLLQVVLVIYGAFFAGLLGAIYKQGADGGNGGD